MTVNQKMTGRAASLPGGLAIAAAVSMLATLVIVVTGAVLVSNEIIAFENIGYCSMAAILLGSFFGAITAVSRIKRQKVLVGILSGGVHYLVLLSITALFFGGQYKGMGVTLLVVIGGSLLGVIFSNREKGRGTTGRRRKIPR